MPEITAWISVFRVCQCIWSGNVCSMLVTRSSASLQHRCIGMIKCPEKNPTSSEGKRGLVLGVHPGPGRTKWVEVPSVPAVLWVGQTVLHLGRRRIPLHVYCFRALNLHYCNYSGASWRQPPACRWTYFVWVYRIAFTWSDFLVYSCQVGIQIVCIKPE